MEGTHLTIRLEPKEHKAFKAKCDKEKTTKSKVIKKAIDKFMKQKSKTT